MKFIHAADMHIDSPLHGLSCYEGAPVNRLRGATRRALENLVSVALEERVDFVVIAGDLFNGQWRDMQTGLFTAGQFRRLERENIPVFLVRGNHDAESQVRQAITWPTNVREFSARRAETIRLDALGVALHGRSFASPEVPDDPIPDYPAPLPDCFNIGLLHTNVDGTPGHDRYAPTSRKALENKGYQYWALGHIHKRQTISEEPYIAYSGNLQGRHVNEGGPKGCLLVTVEDRQIEQVEFRATDVVRWYRADIALRPTDGLPELYAAVQDKLQQCVAQSDGCLAAVRLVLRGRCAAHRALLHRGQQEEAVGQIRNLANEWDEAAWVEEVRWEMAPPLDVEQLRQGGDLLGDLLRQVQHLGETPEGLAAIGDRLGVLEAYRAGVLKEAGIDVRDPERVRAWLAQAEGLLLSSLLEGGDS